MYQNDEVLSFQACFGKKNKIEVIEKLAHFDKAPYGMKEDSSIEELNRVLFKFFNGRTIASARWDYRDILKATKCKDEFELSFKGHGLSLSNHYWYRKEDERLRYEDINFFTNKWDDSFGRAVLNEDYKALETACLNVPDIVTAGWAVKGWIYDGEPKLCKLGIDKGHSEEALGEVLASELAQRMFSKDEVLEYKLKMINGQYASVSKCMVGIDEEMVPLSSVLPNELYFLYTNRRDDREFFERFLYKLTEYGYAYLNQFFVKLKCLKSLCFVRDLHFGNISIIRNLTTGAIRVAPIYDLAGAYGGTKRGRDFLANLNKGTIFMVYFFFGRLDPKWDYSWYDPDQLIGFEDEMRKILSESDFYTDELIDNIIAVYQNQKQTLDEMAEKQKKR